MDTQSVANPSQDYKPEDDDSLFVEDRRDDLPIHIRAKGNENVIVIHGDVDDLPLTPNAFRLYVHMARLSGASFDRESVSEKLYGLAYRDASHAELLQVFDSALGELIHLGVIGEVSA